VALGSGVALKAAQAKEQLSTACGGAGRPLA
jgi:hypothetical protein